MKTKELMRKIFRTKKRIIAFSVSLAVIILCVFCLATYNRTPEADITALNKLLIEASDLTTAKLNITNIYEHKDEGIKILNRADFTMVYKATVWAGIDMKKVEVIPNDLTKVIRVNIPKATIQDAKVDSSSIKYFDEKIALFNVDAKEDANKAVVIAENAAKEEAIKTGILELADKQSATLIEGLLSKAIPEGYTLEAKVVD